jgi:hypothetical protein
MRARKAAKQIKRSYRDPEYTVRNYQKCAETLIQRMRRFYTHRAKYYMRLAKTTKDSFDRMSYQNLTNYYIHQSARYTGMIWQDIEELWLFDKQDAKCDHELTESELKDIEL